MLLGDWLDDAVLDDVMDDWSKLRVHEEVSVLLVSENVRLDVKLEAGVCLTIKCPKEDELVSNALASVWRSFKERNCVNFMEQLQ